MGKALKISIIICTYNRDRYLFDTLRHIAENDFPTTSYEIVLIDNNSTDTTPSVCQRFARTFPQVCFRYFSEPAQGLSFARNRGMREARGEWLVFLDDDAFVNPDYLHHLACRLADYPDAVAFGGKITPLYESGKEPIWMSRWSYSWVSALDMGKDVRLFTADKFPIGANMGFRKECTARYGYFNTELGRNKNNLMAGEEKDYFNRLKSKQEKIYYFPDIEVEHVIPEKRTTDTFIKQLALGIGKSERIRTLAISKYAFFKRILTEGVKWGASLLLYIGYCCRTTPQKGSKLLLFRLYVSRGLLQKTNYQS